MSAEVVTIPVHLPAYLDLANLTLSLNLSFTDYDWEAEVREVIQLTDFNQTIEQFREDKRHLSEPAYSIILLCYFLVLVVAGLGTTELNFDISIHKIVHVLKIVRQKMKNSCRPNNILVKVQDHGSKIISYFLHSGATLLATHKVSHLPLTILWFIQHVDV